MSNSFLFAIIPSSNALPDFQTLKVRPFRKSSTISSNHAVSFVPYTKPRWVYWKQWWKWFLGLSLRKAPYKRRCCSNSSLKGKVTETPLWFFSSMDLGMRYSEHEATMIFCTLCHAKKIVTVVRNEGGLLAGWRLHSKAEQGRQGNCYKQCSCSTPGHHTFSHEQCSGVLLSPSLLLTDKSVMLLKCKSELGFLSFKIMHIPWHREPTLISWQVPAWSCITWFLFASLPIPLQLHSPSFAVPQMTWVCSWFRSFWDDSLLRIFLLRYSWITIHFS